MSEAEGVKRWKEKEVFSLLQTIDTLQVLKMLDAKKKNHESIFKKVSEEMATKGYTRSSKQCQVVCIAF